MLSRFLKVIVCTRASLKQEQFPPGTKLFQHRVGEYMFFSARCFLSAEEAINFLQNPSIVRRLRSAASSVTA